MIGLQALKIAVEEGAISLRPTLARLPGLPKVLRELYAVAGGMADIIDLDWSHEKPGPFPEGLDAYSRIIDLRDFAFDPAFRGVSMVDFFLRNLGVDPAFIETARKRNSWLSPRLPVQGKRRRDYVLVCPLASMPIRCMPVQFHEAILAYLSRHFDITIVSQATLPRETTFAGLCSLVSSAALVISTDTAMVHLADAFAVPCLAFFPTHKPEWRARDYPLCHAVPLSSNLPEALEFSRDAADIAASEAAWFPKGADLSWLHGELSNLARLYLPAKSVRTPKVLIG